MKKLLLSLFVIFTFSFYAIYQSPSNQSAIIVNKNPVATTINTPINSPSSAPTNNTVTNAVNNVVNSIKNMGEGGGDDAGSITPRTSPTKPVTVPKTTPIPVTTPKPTPTPTPAPKTVVAPKGQYRDGQYTGNASYSHGYDIQVTAVIKGGKLADAVANYPQSSRTSEYINSQAIPYLVQQALQAQSANINGVSGASETSAAFADSLSTALAMAKN